MKKNAEGQPVERFEQLRLEAYREFVRDMPCLLHGAACRYEESRSDAAHVRGKATGAGDAGNLVPLCRAHHQELHQSGPRTFYTRTGLNLSGIAEQTWLAFEKSQGVPAL